MKRASSKKKHRAVSTFYGGVVPALAFTLVAFSGVAQKAGVAPEEPRVTAADLPRVAPTPPDAALKTFKIKSGFRIELVAAEPLVMDPIALAFDEDGRLFVVEMRDYSERRNERLGRIRLLEDTNQDGFFEKSSVYADDLPWPTAVICWKGGIFVGATPDIYYCKDIDGDGKADVRKVVMTGFGQGAEPLNVQQLFNSFNWGLDNRIHGATGGNGGVVPRRPGTGQQLMDLKGLDFSFDPETLEVFAESGGGQHGLSFNREGRKFICNNSSHIRLVMYEDRYLRRNPFFPAPPPALDIPADGPASEVYRISPDEQWRVVRTRWRVAGQVPGPIEGGGRPSGYFTGATGITIYRGDLWPADYVGDAFIADCGSNLIHRKKLRPKGVALEAVRPEDEQKVEFLASTDNWFRPVQMANGPEGGLYIADMYREIIEHPWSLPPSLKAHLDLNSGNDRGRIYRIVPDNYRYQPPAFLGACSTPQLVAALDSANGWRRDTAARLLYERRDKTSVTALEDLILHSSNPWAQVHALYALSAQQMLTVPILLRALEGSSAVVRQHAIRLSETFPLDSPDYQAVAEKLDTLVEDPDLQVRYQLAFTLGELPMERKIRPLAALARQDLDDPFFRAALLSSCQTGGGHLLTALGAKSLPDPSSATGQFYRQLAAVVGAQNRQAEDDEIIRILKMTPESPAKLSFLLGLANGLRQRGRTLTAAFPEVSFDRSYAYAVSVIPDRSEELRLRADALSFVALDPERPRVSRWAALLRPDESPEIHGAAMAALDAVKDLGQFREVLTNWNHFTPQVKAGLLDLLTRRAERLGLLLNAVEGKLVAGSELSPAQMRRFHEAQDPSIRQRSMAVFKAQPSMDRQEILRRFRPALEMKGNQARGREIYEKLCVSCHQLEGKGGKVGPDLATVRQSGKEKNLGNIIDPNREVAPNYVNYLVETSDGQVLSGPVSAETGTTVILRSSANPEIIILRKDIRSFKSEGISAMPEGLEASLSIQDMADLLELLDGAGSRSPLN